MKKKLTVLLSIFLILFTSIVTLLFLNSPSFTNPPQPVNGVLDLSRCSFENQGNIQLNGKWDFYYNQFLTHDDFIKGVSVEPVQLSLPCTAASLKDEKPFSSNKFYGTLRLIVKLPEDSNIYGLRTDIILTSYRLYLNGNLADKVGVAGVNKEESKAEYNKRTTYFNPVKREIEIIYHTADFTAADATIVAPTLGLASNISKEAQIGMGSDFLLFGMLLIMGIYHLGLYIMRRKNKAPLFFSIFCLLFSFRILLVGERFLPNNLDLGFWVFSRMAYICVFIGFASLCGFLYHSIEDLFARWYYYGMLILSVGCSIFVVFVPYTWMNYSLIVFAVFGVLSLIYAMTRLITGAVRKYPYALIMFMGFVFLGFTFINDLIYQITLVNTPSLIPLGIAVFTLLQAYTLSARFSQAFTHAEQLSEQNASITEELKLVNSNLELLVEERTHELQMALEETDLLSKTDYLTKLPNRRRTLEIIQSFVKDEIDFYIGIADLDRFKEVNDQHGHAKGDEILVEVSQLLKEAVGEDGFVGRWGGEEFIIVLKSNQLEVIHEKANHICHSIADYYFTDIQRSITITLGLCVYNPLQDINAIIAAADRGLYEGKKAGRNRYTIIQD